MQMPGDCTGPTHNGVASLSDVPLPRVGRQRTCNRPVPAPCRRWRDYRKSSKRARSGPSFPRPSPGRTAGRPPVCPARVPADATRAAVGTTSPRLGSLDPLPAPTTVKGREARRCQVLRDQLTIMT